MYSKSMLSKCVQYKEPAFARDRTDWINSRIIRSFMQPSREFRTETSTKKCKYLEELKKKREYKVSILIDSYDSNYRLIY